MSQRLEKILDSVVLITGTERNDFGTGFAMHSECGATWVVTCAHVVRKASKAADILKAEDIRVDDKPAEILSCGKPQEADLAVLKVRGLAIPPLRLGLAGRKDMPCSITGFAELADEVRRAEPLECTLGNRVVLKAPEGPRVKAWKLWIEGKTLLESGYSGSPVVCSATGTVVAVASHSEYQGERGYAVSLVNLKHVWPDLSPQLISFQAPTSSSPDQQQREFLEDLFRNLPVSSEQLRTWCFEAVPGNVPHEIPPNANSFDLLAWLEGKGPLSGGQIPLLSVLRKLLPRVVDTEDRTHLEQCIDDIGHRFGISEVSGPVETISPKIEGPVLMLEIWPKAPPGNCCNVQGWLVYSAERSFKVYPKDQEDALDLEDEDNLIRLVDDLCGILSKHNVEEKNVVVEFILPRALLDQTVEQWTDQFDDPLGTRFPIVVRPRERLRDPTQRLGWTTCWGYLSVHRKKALGKSIWWFDESQRRDVRDKLQEGLCIALCFVPDLLAPPRQNTVLYLLHHGASVMLWPRQQAAAWTQQFQKFVAAKTVEDLPEVVRDVRHKLWQQRKENAPCYNVTLLWDDPHRRIPDEPKSDDDFLQGPTES